MANDALGRSAAKVPLVPRRRSRRDRGDLQLAPLLENVTPVLLLERVHKRFDAGPHNRLRVDLSPRALYCLEADVRKHALLENKVPDQERGAP